MKEIIAVLAFLTMAGCATTPQLSSTQRRALQTRTFEDTNYDNVFRAFKAVLQDDGYIIKNQDFEGGMIQASVQKTDAGAGWARLQGAQNYRTGEGFEVSINLEKLNPKVTESRVTIQKTEQFSLGGQQGREILDQKIYKSLYDKVTVEVNRRKAKGRG